MGHVVNPISFRLGFNRYWNSSWAISDLKNYAHITNQDYYIKKIIFSFFEQWTVHSANFLVSDVKILRKHTFVNLFVYLYDSTWEEFLGDLYYQILDVYRYSIFFVKRAQAKKSSSFSWKKPLKKWDRRYKLKKVLKVYHAAKIPRLHFKAYLKELFFFYIFYVRIYIQRPIFNFVKNVLLSSIYKFFSSKARIKLYFIGLTNDTVTATFLSKFISIKLERSYFLFRVLSTINRSLRVLMRKRVLYGYRIKISGRYSRNQKAVVLLNGIGAFSRSSTEARLDYSFNIARLRYSVCGIKIWLASASKNGFLRRIRRNHVLKHSIKGTEKTNKLRRLNIRKLNSLTSSYLII